MPNSKKNKGGNTVAVVTKLAEQIAEELSLRIWDVEFVKEGASYFLRIYIDRDDLISIEDCENFSRKIDKLLDEVDPIEQTYYLEISSPGIERELKKPIHFKTTLGKQIQIRLIRPKDGQREFYGHLVDYNEKKQITIRLSNQEFQTFEFAECAWVKLVDTNT
jgi:ribosome maturation factor RimP